MPSKKSAPESLDRPPHPDLCLRHVLLTAMPLLQQPDLGLRVGSRAALTLRVTSSPLKYLDSMGAAQQLALLLRKALQGVPASVQLLEEADATGVS